MLPDLRPFFLLLPCLLLACATSMPAAAPGARNCTTLGCVNGFSLDFSAPSWPPGKYTVELTVDGQRGTCEATLPLQANATARCSLPGVSLGLSGSALPADQHSLSGLQWSNARPALVEVSVLRDGAPVGKPASFRPAYTTSRPNGPDCEPVCTGASASMTL
ncbi:MAG: hypothetical protein MUF64_01240 [Polyangiaceae bacterium]|jgi:hypothetical protein|nr:hypothetical protein [Polyangiaceae bacterium]